MLDVRLDPSWTQACPGETQPSVAFFGQQRLLTSYQVGLVGGEQARLILLDIGKGDVLGIEIRSTYPDRFATLVSAAMPIVESLRVK